MDLYLTGIARIKWFKTEKRHGSGEGSAIHRYIHNCAIGTIYSEVNVRRTEKHCIVTKSFYKVIVGVIVRSVFCPEITDEKSMLLRTETTTVKMFSSDAVNRGRPFLR